ncbi:class I SAM-dependent methyltransferase [Nonomuraea sp. NPDC049480]|uniref:class I SAM-dependent methyltransferase n=1 Tax=Nonomuraea sp. NPDC049480 TaxID=3364353 RepID=UPI0037BCBCC8
MGGIVNTAQAQAWNGYEGEHWAAHDDRYDAVNSGFNRFLLEAAGIGERDRILDVGCGNGQLTRLAAGQAPRGYASGVDLSGPMLAKARARAAAEHVPNVSFEQGDVQVHPFQEGAFDVALSRFGVMFFADPVAAFANIRRALRPAGRLAFVCLTQIAGTDLGAVFGAMAPYLPSPTGADGSGPTSFADPARIRCVLADAGFQDVTCTHVEADQIWGRDVADAAEFLTGWGPVRYHMTHAGPEAAAHARDALTAALGPFAQPGAVRLRGTAWLVTAVVP